MHIAEMLYVHQIVGDQLVIAGDMERFAAAALCAHPVRVVRPPPVWDQLVIGKGRIAHPDPNPIPPLDQRIGHTSAPGGIFDWPGTSMQAPVASNISP